MQSHELASLLYRRGIENWGQHDSERRHVWGKVFHYVGFSRVTVISCPKLIVKSIGREAAKANKFRDEIFQSLADIRGESAAIAQVREVIIAAKRG